MSDYGHLHEAHEKLKAEHGALKQAHEALKAERRAERKAPVPTFLPGGGIDVLSDPA